MNSFLYNNKKKLVALAAVVIICAACLVTAAYAYNAAYKDTVEQKGLKVIEDGKYFYVTGDLTYAADTVTPALTVESIVNTTTVVNDSGTTITGERVGYTITGVYPDGSTDNASSNILTDSTILYKVGTLTIHNKNIGAITAYLSISSFIQKKDYGTTTSTDNEEHQLFSIFKSDLSDSNVVFKLANSDGTVKNNNEIDSVEFTDSGSSDAYVNVYVKGDIDTTPKEDRFHPRVRDQHHW